ncbi:galectin-6-like [Salminus brasiliensis]|uniref:galectin-6-like n=1 Tax=Salminus brasiliensis TaxID=930266 RepID=UPI003B8355DB
MESSSWSMKSIQIDVSHPVSNPVIPYVGTIPNGIKPDMAVCFQGTVPANFDQFAINFKTGPSNEDDIAFHFKPCIGQKVALNSFRSGKWESEESASVEPFTKEAAFNMFVVITAEGYEVYVNGLKHSVFKHRIPVEKVSTLDIRGDVSMHILGYIDAIPYVGTIPEVIKPDMAVCFQGTVPENADQFAINFKTGPSNEDDISFHFNPHMGQKVALNSFRSGKWESEESASVELFTKGAAFSIFVVIRAEGYEVNVNGMELCMYKHRVPLEKVSVLEITGNVSIDMVGFVMNWSKESFFSQQE